VAQFVQERETAVKKKLGAKNSKPGKHSAALACIFLAKNKMKPEVKPTNDQH